MNANEIGSEGKILQQNTLTKATTTTATKRAT